MIPAFEMAASVANPIEAVDEMALSLDRARAVLAGNNTDLVEEIAQGSDVPAAIAERAMQMWMINVVVLEKLDEIGKVLERASAQIRRASPVGAAA